MENQQHTFSGPIAAENTATIIREIIYQIRRIIQAGELYTKELNRKYQLSVAQLNCLLALFEHGPLSLSQIARYMMVKGSTVTGVVDRLEQKGLVIRMRKSPDRRVITIQLTDTGKDLAENAPPPVQKKIIDGLTKLPEVERREVLGALSTLTTMLDVQDLEVEYSDPIHD